MESHAAGVSVLGSVALGVATRLVGVQGNPKGKSRNLGGLPFVRGVCLGDTPGLLERGCKSHFRDYRELI